MEEGSGDHLVVPEDRDHRQGSSSSGMLQPPGSQSQDEGLGRRDRDFPAPSSRPTLNGHCVWFPAVASSPARTLVFLPQPEASPLISKQRRRLHLPAERAGG